MRIFENDQRVFPQKLWQEKQQAKTRTVHKKNMTVWYNLVLRLDVRQSKNRTSQLYFDQYATRQTYPKISTLVVPFMPQSEVWM